MTWIGSLPRTTRAQKRRDEAFLAVIDSTQGAMLRLLANALDHAATLSTALRSDRVVVGSALTLSRGALEALLQVCYVLDPKAAPRTALLRALAYELATIEGNEATAKVFGDMASRAQRERARVSVDGVHRWLTKSGFSRGPAKNPRQSVWVGYEDARVSLKFNVTDAMRDYLFGEGFFYAVLSGAAHSRGWMLATSYLPDDAGHVTTPEQQALVSTIPLLDASEALVKSVAWYVGIDPTPTLNKTHVRRRALLTGRGTEFSPMSLEDYRGQKKPTQMGRAFTLEPGRWGLGDGK
jgi:hypothetical protein